MFKIKETVQNNYLNIENLNIYCTGISAPKDWHKYRYAFTNALKSGSVLLYVGYGSTIKIENGTSVILVIELNEDEKTITYMDIGYIHNNKFYPRRTSYFPNTYDFSCFHDGMVTFTSLAQIKKILAEE